MSKVLVIGAGQIGTSVVRHLTERGADVLAADAEPAAGYFQRFSKSPLAELRVLDIRDSVAVDDMISAWGPEAVVLAAGPVGQACANDFDSARETNIAGAANVAAATSRHSVRRLVFISSIAVYGSTTAERLSEDEQVSPRSPYGTMKMEAEQELFRTEAKVSTYILRPCGVFGPLRFGRGSHSARFIESLLVQAKNRKSIEIRAEQGTWDQYLYVHDLGRIVATVATDQAGIESSIFNVAPDNVTTASDLRDALAVLFPEHDVRLEELPQTRVPLPPMCSTRLAQRFGVSPTFTLVDALRDYAIEMGVTGD